MKVEQDVLGQRWQAQDAPPVGGSSDSSGVTANGQTVDIPSYVVAGQASAAGAVAVAIQALVPQSMPCTGPTMPPNP